MTTRNALLTLLAVASTIGQAAPPPQPVPWSTLSDVPLGAWFRGVPDRITPSLYDCVTWSRVTDVHPGYGMVWIQERGYTPEQMLGRFEWSPAPFTERVGPWRERIEINPCGKTP